MALFGERSVSIGSGRPRGRFRKLATTVVCQDGPKAAPGSQLQRGDHLSPEHQLLRLPELNQINPNGARQTGWGPLR